MTDFTFSNHSPLQRVIKKNACVSGLLGVLHSHQRRLVHLSPRPNSGSSGFQLLTCLRTAKLTEAQGISRILSSRIVTRSIKLPLTFARHLGAHRKPSSISLPLHAANMKRNLFWFTWSFQRETFGIKCVFQTSSTLRKRFLSTRELSLFWF